MTKSSAAADPAIGIDKARNKDERTVVVVRGIYFSVDIVDNPAMNTTEY